MIGLFLELVELMIKVTVIVAILIAKAIAAAYRFTEQVVHQHRVSKNPQAPREVSQLIAGTIVAGGIGILVLIGSLSGNKPAGAHPTAAQNVAEVAQPTAVAASVHSHGMSSRHHRALARERRLRHLRAVARRRHARALAHRRALAHARRLAHRRALARARRERGHAAAVAAASACNPNYSGCLRADASDYDCEGGSGDGPYYTGPVRVIGEDVYDLDRDGDGVGCDT